MTDTTPRLGLPLLAPGQAQKELFHNEALGAIDALVQATIETLGDGDPPSDPATGACWIVGDGPTGAWAGQSGKLASWTDGGWRFAPGVEGMCVWVRANRLEARRIGDGWVLGDVPANTVSVGGIRVLGPQQPAIAPPSSGAVVDMEARTTIAAILAALRGHGLIGR